MFFQKVSIAVDLSSRELYNVERFYLLSRQSSCLHEGKSCRIQKRFNYLEEVRRWRFEL